MNRKYLKRPIYHLAGKTAKTLRDFQAFLDQKLKRKQDQKWNNLFKGKSALKYNFYDTTILLYKDSILSRIIYSGHENQEIDFIKMILKPEDIFIDIGSNIGLFSLIAAPIVGNNGKVICFEPTPQIYERLLENMELNEFNNIDCRNIGLSDSAGELSFYVSKNGFDAWNSLAPSNDGKLEHEIKINVSTLDEELINIDKNRISLVKIDVEGWEKFVLYGGEAFFKNYHPVVMVELTEVNTFNAGYNIHEIYNIMQDWGYRWYRIVNGELVPEPKRIRYPHVNLIAKKD